MCFPFVPKITQNTYQKAESLHIWKVQVSVWLIPSKPSSQPVELFFLVLSSHTWLKKQETPGSHFFLKGVDCWQTTNEPNEEITAGWHDMTDTDFSNWPDSEKRELGMASWNMIIYCFACCCPWYTNWCIGTLQILHILVLPLKQCLPMTSYQFLPRIIFFKTFQNHVKTKIKDVGQLLSWHRYMLKACKHPEYMVRVEVGMEMVGMVESWRWWRTAWSLASTIPGNASCEHST